MRKDYNGLFHIMQINYFRDVYAVRKKIQGVLGMSRKQLLIYLDVRLVFIGIYVLRC